jgi:hypothetical protein
MSRQTSRLFRPDMRRGVLTMKVLCRLTVCMAMTMEDVGVPDT